MLVLSQRSGIARRIALQAIEQFAHFDAASGEHDLDWILGQTVFQRSDFGQERPIDVEEPSMTGMLPVDRFENDLSFSHAIEHDGSAAAMFGHFDQNRSGDVAREERAHHRSTVARFHDRAVAEDQGKGTGQGLKDGSCEIVSAARRERHLNPGINGAAHRIAIRSRYAPLTVEKRTVNVERQKANHKKMGKRLRPERGAKPPSESERGWGPASSEERGQRKTKRDKKVLYCGPLVPVRLARLGGSALRTVRGTHPRPGAW